MPKSRKRRRNADGGGVESEVAGLALGAHDSRVGAPMEVTLAGGAGSDTLRVPKWVWRKFTSSARSDGLELAHWEKEAAVRDDYIFAEICAKTAEVVQYTDDEYDRFCPSDSWTKPMTDELIAMAKRYGCRWHVVADRFPYEKSLEEIKDRYYTVARNIAAAYCSVLAQRGSTSALALASKVPIIDKPFNREYEEKRKSQANAVYFASNKITNEQAFLRRKLVEYGLAKPKPGRASASASSATPEGKASSSRNSALKRVAARKAREAFRAKLLEHLEALRAAPAAEAGAEAAPAASSSSAAEAAPATASATSAASEASTAATAAAMALGDDGEVPAAKKAKRALTLTESIDATKRVLEFSRPKSSRATQRLLGKVLTRMSGIAATEEPFPRHSVVLRSRMIKATTNWSPSSVPSQTVTQVNSFLEEIGLAEPLATSKVNQVYRDVRAQAMVLAELVAATSAMAADVEVLRKQVLERGLELPKVE
ncbi:DNA methyltransferase 1-associated protein 1 [Thecamonas trahens ATCC 50062]|uniref:DNA methyltransferase 1-associated protein 1 n=1 Tax=Thecamonas trahens ATCC 50062 TaxID=461836 RepID=A0A0L0D770_THETB|nr:DNA methyltransferase 1-associated protein 1 [Thecamonas trahens ATCC 50062]KNC47138.1 DNA methyltransferase 1-associated protein 1 [Thecamonas trahens ATCC 50062]|eukprot:XP_013759914.1 DNA methyltransferase 1-associated protein 1 [Thecamonas trahens ATCC 50062]